MLVPCVFLDLLESLLLLLALLLFLLPVQLILELLLILLLPFLTHGVARRSLGGTSCPEGGATGLLWRVNLEP